MDELAQYNIERWQALADAAAVFTRPALNLDPHLAQAQLDPERRLGDVVGKDVLCLPDAHAEPGTWAHLVWFAPPWLSFWAAYHPELTF